MNVILALEQLGYINITDFEIHADDTSFIAVWNHADSQPDQSTLDAAWAAWEVANQTPLVDLQTNAKRIIDQTAEAVRLQYVTPGSSQSMVYQEKGDEAADYVANGYPADLSSYPFIQAEVNATGKTATEASDDILTQKSAWIVVGAAVEEVRIGGKMNIDAAADEAEVETIRDAALAALAVI
jgi:hypothetical protein